MDDTARTPDQLAQILKARRKTQALSQTQVGIRAGLRQNTISALELRPSSSSVDSLYKVLSTLGLELVIRNKTPSTSSNAEW